MNARAPLPDDKKLTVIFRVEPGCLGPDGKDHVEGFCRFAQSAFAPIDAEFVSWQVVPRYDKSLPETQYEIGNRKLPIELAARYLATFQRDIDAFEGHLHDTLTTLIEQFQAG